MTDAPLRVRPSLFLQGVWTAYCRRCLWYRSYRSWPVAIRAALQHLSHFIEKEKTQ